jgi:hypothetical protein
MAVALRRPGAADRKLIYAPRLFRRVSLESYEKHFKSENFLKKRPIRVFDGNLPQG